MKFPYVKCLWIDGHRSGDGPNTTTTIIFTNVLNLMFHQVGTRWLIGFHCVESAFDAASRGTQELKNGAPRGELGRVCPLAIPLCILMRLAETLAAVADGGDMFMPVTQYVMNPKSITQGQL